MRPIRMQQQESPFVCAACGADRGCDCNAPVVERLREIKENTRQRSATYRKRKARVLPFGHVMSGQRKR
jgi:hypothetical protein